MLIKRTLENHLSSIISAFPSVMVTGSRQVGKSTLLENFVRDYNDKNKIKYGIVTLDDMNEAEKAQNDPMLFLEDHKPPVLIDEVQYAPNLFKYIKIHIDRHKGENGLFLLTGSQKFTLMKGVQESLAGRVAILDLYGLSQSEIENRESLVFLPNEEYLRTIREKCDSNTDVNANEIYKKIFKGSFPVLAKMNDSERNLYFSSYIKTYLNRDVRDILRVSNLNLFNNFLKSVAARTGCILNYADLSRDCGIDAKTASAWLDVLQSSGLVRLLYPYYNNFTKRLTKSPKIYFLDTGLCSYLVGWDSAITLQNGAMGGSILETFVFSEILKSYCHNAKEPIIHFYRDKDGREVDFLIENNGVLYPIEVKKTMMPKSDSAKNFSALEALGKPIADNIVLSLRSGFSHINNRTVSLPVWCI